MQDWDRLVVIFVSAALGAYTCYRSWLLWREGERLGAVGIALLAVVSVAAPALLAVAGV